MNHKLMLAITGIAVVLIAAGGLGYAFTYTGTTSSTDNDVDSSVMSVEILQNNAPLSGRIEVPSPSEGSTSIMIDSNYELRVVSWTEGDLNVAAWVEMSDPRIWAVVSSVVITVNGIDHTCGRIEMQTGMYTTFTLAATTGESGGTEYPLSITLNLTKNVDKMSQEEKDLFNTTFNLRFAVGEGNVII